LLGKATLRPAREDPGGWWTACPSKLGFLGAQRLCA
jgi:hypothetical protein